MNGISYCMDAISFSRGFLNKFVLAAQDSWVCEIIFNLLHSVFFFFLTCILSEVFSERNPYDRIPRDQLLSIEGRLPK